MTKSRYAHYSQTTGEIRIYDQQQGYQKRHEYLAITNVLWLSDDQAMLRGAKGTLDVRSMLAICQAVKNKGAKQLIIKRKKGKKIPMAQLTKQGKYEDTYTVDLINIEGLK